MTAYTLTVTDHGDVAAIADGGQVEITVSDGTSSEGGAVTSVNGDTGAVVLTAADVGAATAAQGALADSATQPGDLATVATSGAYSDLTGKPTLGTAAAANTGDFDAAGAAAAALVSAEAYTDAAVDGLGGGGGTVDAVVAGTGISVDSTDPANPIVTNTGATAAQGSLADSAVQPGDLATVATSGAYTDLTGTPTLGDAAAKNVGSSAGTVAAGDDSRITGAAQKASNLGDLASASSARTNLGLGTSAVLDVPSSGDAGTGQVVKGNDTRLTNARTPSAHASTHASAGSDPVTLAQSQVTNLTTDLAAKAPLASPALTGNPTAPTPSGGDNDTSIATTAFVQGEISAKAPLASPTFTGNPAAPTPSAGDNDTSIATTAFVTNAVAKQPEVLIIAYSDETTAITTGTAKVTFRMPFAMTLTAVRASLTTASTASGPHTVDINEAGTTILSTKLTIDDNEKTSTTAATAAVISDASLADDAEITIDVDTAGTGAKGGKVYLIGTRT